MMTIPYILFVGPKIQTIHEGKNDELCEPITPTEYTIHWNGKPNIIVVDEPTTTELPWFHLDNLFIW
jgi:hypothetical protein